MAGGPPFLQASLSQNGTLGAPTGGPLKPSFGLSGAVQGAKLSLCLGGLRRFPKIRAASFCDLLLLPATRILYFSSGEAHVRARLGARATQFWALRLWLCGHARTPSSASQRAGAANPRPGQRAGFAPVCNCPTQAKRRLEWTTRRFRMFSTGHAVIPWTRLLKSGRYRSCPAKLISNLSCTRHELTNPVGGSSQSVQANSSPPCEKTLEFFRRLSDSLYVSKSTMRSGGFK